MSKAFTREMDEAEEPAARAAVPRLPAGARNYITAHGMRRLRRELDQARRNPSAGPARPEARELQARLESAVVVEPPPLPWNQVLFGATVTVRDRHGEPATYRLVGVDEADPERYCISWLSPLARALLKARLGDRVHFRSPEGVQELEITAIHYEL